MSYLLYRYNEIYALVLNSFSYLPVPKNINFMYNWGSTISVVLVLQILTGLFLSMHYVSNYILSFDSVVHIQRDVVSGWMMRSMHSNGASLFMFCIFMHISRSLYYKSYYNIWVWVISIILLVLSMLTSFLGYVLPWGQMSFWGATVITNFLSVIPFYSPDIVVWLWGGYSVGGPTLTRFFSLHFLFPFIIAVFSLLHLVFLHRKSSTNPLMVNSSSMKMTFWPYSGVKDLVGFFIILIVYMYICFMYPSSFSDPENFLKANPMVTPVHIKPEWYFLFAYAILRCIPNKTMGVVALVASVLVFVSIPIYKLIFSKIVKGSGLLFKLNFWVFSATFVLLTWLGGSPVEEPYVMLAQVMTLVYFMSVVFMCLL